jgi:hypothetical protein
MNWKRPSKPGKNPPAPPLRKGGRCVSLPFVKQESYSLRNMNKLIRISRFSVNKNINFSLEAL